MLDSKKLIEEAMTLPAELRAKLAEQLLRSLNPSQPEIDRLWAEEAERRIAEVDAGDTKPVPGEKVFDEIKKRFHP